MGSEQESRTLQKLPHVALSTCEVGGLASYIRHKLQTTIYKRLVQLDGMWSIRRRFEFEDTVKKSRKGETIVLLYHRIGMPGLASLVAGQYVFPRLFRAQLDYLTFRGWNPATLPQIVENLSKVSLPTENTFAITFDDAYLSVYEHACPALSNKDMTATIFAVVDQIGGVNEWDCSAGDVREPLMSAGQIRELAELGFEIGSHTLTHAHLTDLNDENLRREIVDSKHKLEDLIGKEVAAFSYPYGEYDERVIAVVAEAGYKYAVSTKLGTVRNYTTAFEIPRINVRWNSVGRLLMRKIHRARKASQRRR